LPCHCGGRCFPTYRRNFICGMITSKLAAATAGGAPLWRRRS
jgi:hypothetical protein